MVLGGSGVTKNGWGGRFQYNMGTIEPNIEMTKWKRKEKEKRYGFGFAFCRGGAAKAGRWSSKHLVDNNIDVEENGFHSGGWVAICTVLQASLGWGECGKPNSNEPAGAGF